MVNHHLVILYPQHPSYTSSWHPLWTKKWLPFEIPHDNLQSTAYIQLMCVRQNGEWNMVQSVLYTAWQNRKAVYPGVIWVTVRLPAMSTLGLRYWLLIAALQKWWYTIYHIPWYGTVALVSSSTYVYMGLSVSCRNFHALQLPYNAVSSPVTQPLLVVPRRQDWGVVSPQGKADLYKLI